MATPVPPPWPRLLRLLLPGLVLGAALRGAAAAVGLPGERAGRGRRPRATRGGPETAGHASGRRPRAPSPRLGCILRVSARRLAGRPPSVLG